MLDHLLGSLDFRDNVAEVSEVKGVHGVRCTFESKVAVVELDAAARDEAERAMTKMGYRIAPVPLPAQPADSK